MEIDKAQWHSCDHMCCYVSIKFILICSFTIKKKPNSIQTWIPVSTIVIALYEWHWYSVQKIILGKERVHAAHTPHTFLLTILLITLICSEKLGRQPDLTPQAQIPWSIQYSLPIFTLQISSFSTTPYHSTLIICSSLLSQVHYISLLSTLTNQHYLWVFEALS